MPEVAVRPESERQLTVRRFSRRYFLRMGVRSGIACSALTLGSLVEAREIEPKWIEITRHRVVLPNLPRAFDGFTIAHISDLHADDPTCSYNLEHVCELTSAQNADTILISGDFSSGPAEQTASVLTPGLSHLHAREGVFGILGNHDYYYGRAPEVRKALKRSGVTELFNDVHAVQRGKNRLFLCGIDDFWKGTPDIAGVAAQVPHGGAAIVMGHEPDFADEVVKQGKFGLMLSGHSHGGQVAFPVVGPLRLPPHCSKYPRGRYQLNEMTLYTNRGLGTVDLPLRFCARPEIAIFTLTCA